MPEFKSKNDAAMSLRKGIEESIYKDCVHIEISGGSDGGFHFYPFRVYCDQHSFVDTKTRLYDSRCPTDCLLYVNKQVVAKQERHQKRWHNIGVALGTPFRWFAKLPTLSQALLIFLVIVLCAPKVAESIISLIKALK